MENTKFKIGVIDDHFAIRDGYKSLLETWKYASAVNTYKSVKEFYLDYQSNILDLVFLDIELPGENGLDECRKIKNKNFKIKIIILSAHHDEQYIINAYDSNADGYLFKDATKNEVLDAIQKVLFSNEKYFNHEALSIIFQFQESTRKKNSNGKTDLSEREIQILKLICEGHSNDQISAILNRTTSTIATHRQNIMNKTNVHNSLELMNYAIRNGYYIPIVKKKQ
jgi:DNA-binding NarL/FixJ family response regulator